ncbi:MAG: 3-demethylubiquinone-9 3-methyltransferase [Polaromonas sp.]|nr:3-demethylubiquinone-9 3-methyltransferase [Polaromonas sp.]
MQVQPYIFFDGRCEEALTFYKTAIGAEIVMMMRFSENPEPQPGMDMSGKEDKIMHASFRIGESEVMASDGYAKGQPEFKGITLSIFAPDEAQATKMFNALSEGGKVNMPLAKTFYSPCFGMVADKFGMPWMVNVQAPTP